MKKLIGSALLSLGLLAGSAQAALIVDVVEQNQFIGWGGEYSYRHNLNDKGFTLGSALSGTLDIQVRDDNRGWDELVPEVILFVIGDFDFDTGGISLFGDGYARELGVKALGSLNSDGDLDVTVSSVLGDFWLGNSILSVTTAQVPGPGALGLVVIGLAGLFGVSRRKQRAEQVYPPFLIIPLVHWSIGCYVLVATLLRGNAWFDYSLSIPLFTYYVGSSPSAQRAVIFLSSTEP